MMAEFTGIGTSEMLTSAAYLVLLGMLIWLVAHLISVFRGLVRPRIRDIRTVADLLGRDLRRITGLGEHELDACSRNLTEASPPLEWLETRNRLRRLRALGPDKSAHDWTGKDGMIRLPSRLKNVLQMAQRHPDEPLQDVADYVIDQDRTRWSRRLGLLIAAGPPAGAAPTMSATMSFLKSYSDSPATGLPSFAPIHDALLTTYIGCAICVLGIILLAVVQGQFWKYREALVVSATSIQEAARDWDRISDRIDQQVEILERRLHEKPQKA